MANREQSGRASYRDGNEFFEGSDWLRGMEGRRRKAALVLLWIWALAWTLHSVPQGPTIVLAIALAVAVYVIRVVTAKPAATSALGRSTSSESGPAGSNPGQRLATAAPTIPAATASPVATASPAATDWPRVSLLVAAKDEEAVIGNLVKQLCSLDYPRDRYELWIVDDCSGDRTPDVLRSLQAEYPQLRVLRREANAGGGKSGALNQVIPLTQGEILAIFDADAQVPPDLLRRVVPGFQRDRVGAVQLRKSIVQADLGHPMAHNFWIQGQTAEMALDCYLQQQRIAIGGVGELRGNGQFVRRSALLGCGGFNEETITDDLDLTLRIHFAGWDIDCVLVPVVREEGVESLRSLWHQRNRWAEGGYQRYLDYWRWIVSNRMGGRKTLDLAVLWFIQYIVPQASVADLAIAAIKHQMPILTPLLIATFGLSCSGMWIGQLRVIRQTPDQPIPWLRLISTTLLGTLYMAHWVVTIATMSVRISIRPKRLKWVKTVHQGDGDAFAELDLAEPSGGANS